MRIWYGRKSATPFVRASSSSARVCYHQVSYHLYQVLRRLGLVPLSSGSMVFLRRNGSCGIVSPASLLRLFSWTLPSRTNTKRCRWRKFSTERLALNPLAQHLRLYDSSQDNVFPGLLGLVEAYLETLDMDPSERRQINKYVDLVRRRADGPCLYLYLPVPVILRCIRLAANYGDVDARLCSIASLIQI